MAGLVSLGIDRLVMPMPDAEGDKQSRARR